MPLLKAFSKEKIKLQHKAIKNERVRIDMYFSEHKFAVEIDKKGHTDKNQDEENERQTKIEKHSDCKFFHRINPGAEDFDIFLEISKIQDSIDQSNEEKMKEQENKLNKIKNQNKRTRRQNKKKQENKIKEQKRKFTKELLSYVSSISMPVKHIKYFVKKNTAHILKHEKYIIKSRTDKNWNKHKK